MPRQIGEISQALNSGRHTTTTTQWYWLDAARTSGLDRFARLPGVRSAPARARPARRDLMPDLREPAQRMPLLQLHASARAGVRRAGRARARRDRGSALPRLSRDLRRAVRGDRLTRAAPLADEVGEQQQRQQHRPEDAERHTSPRRCAGARALVARRGRALCRRRLRPAHRPRRSAIDRGQARRRYAAQLHADRARRSREDDAFVR